MIIIIIIFFLRIITIIKLFGVQTEALIWTRKGFTIPEGPNGNSKVLRCVMKYFRHPYTSLY